MEVVAGVIVRGGRMLLTQRRPGTPFALTWECPGGKAENYESHHQALARELFEELGVTPDAIEQCPVWSGRQPPIIVGEGMLPPVVSFYRLALRGVVEPYAREGQGLGWFSLTEFVGLQLTPANALALPTLMRCFGKARAASSGHAEPKNQVRRRG